MPQLVKVAITGALSIERAEAIKLIESTPNATYSKSASWDTSYLVATRSDTEKARAAAARGTAVITEEQMLAFIDGGGFPPLRPNERPHELQLEINWTDVKPPEALYTLRYRDASGSVTERFISGARLGKSADGREYLGAFDDHGFKTFRSDSILGFTESTPSGIANGPMSQTGRPSIWARCAAWLRKIGLNRKGKETIQ